MKYSLIFTMVHFALWTFPNPALCAEQDPSQLIEKLESLPIEERSEFYGSLSQETKDAIAKVRSERGQRMREMLEEARKRQWELELQGTRQLDPFLVDGYEFQANKAIERIEDEKQREAEKERTQAKKLALARAIFGAPAPLTIGIWEKHRERIEATWKKYESEAIDLEALQKIEEKLIKPIVDELQEITEAEPEQDKPWWLREKWRHLLVPDETAPQK